MSAKAISFGVRMLLAMVASALGVFALPAPAPAASVTTTGTITGSALSLSTQAAPSFTANLDNGDATPAYSLALTTQDTAGTGAGWNETITSTQFTTGGPGNYTLPATASTVTTVVAQDDAGTDTPPANSITYPLTVPAGPTAPAPVKLFDAMPATGMGRFTITPSISVLVPQNAYASTYTSTLILGIAAGP